MKGTRLRISGCLIIALLVGMANAQMDRGCACRHFQQIRTQARVRNARWISGRFS